MSKRGSSAQALAAALLFGTMACQQQDGTPDDVAAGDPAAVGLGSTGMALAVEVPAETDVRAIRLTVVRVPCGDEEIEPLTLTTDAALEGPLPGDLVPGAVEAGLDADGEYLFGDEFWVLPAGCYDVTVQPLDASGQPSADCAPARAERAVVEAGQTTELVLVSECGPAGDGEGGLDVIGTVDGCHPPRITRLELDPPGTVTSCDGVQACATATDDDGDPLRFVWEQLGGPPLLEGPEVVSREEDGGETTVCVRVVPSRAGVYQLRVTVYDLHPDVDGMLVADPDSKDDRTFFFMSLAECPPCEGEGEGEGEGPAEGEGEGPAEGEGEGPAEGEGEGPAEGEGEGPAEGEGEGPPGPGCTVIYMFTFSNRWVEEPVAAAFAHRAVDWLVTDPEEARILIVLEDNHCADGTLGDAAYIHELLTDMEYDADLVDEPSGGLQLADLEGYDVVWFVAPSCPVDDATTVFTLLEWTRQGGGLVLSGDDLTRPVPGASMTWLTHTDPICDGERLCGYVTDNDQGRGYQVDIVEDVDHDIIEGFEGGMFRYGDDIDHARPRNEGEVVLAWANLFCAPDCLANTPAIIAYCP